MREEFRTLLSDRVHKYGIALSVFFAFFGLLFFLVTVWRLPPVVPMFYNRPWGEAQLGTPLQLLALLLASAGILIGNVILSIELYKRIVLLSRILLWVSVVVTLLATTTVVRIILLIL